jgi:hypothetical protein
MKAFLDATTKAQPTKEMLKEVLHTERKLYNSEI